jgi:hypothetical protein
MSKQTAVEWLVQEINKISVSREAQLFIDKLKQQAKAMEREQIEDAWDDGIDSFSTRSAEQYFNETYGGEK